jgi:hypothetical protein
MAIYSFNQLRLTRILKLPQESDIVFKIFTDVVNAVFEHSDSFDTHSKGESGTPTVWIADILVKGRVNHSGAENFKPSGLRTDPASGPATHDTENINLSARFGERKEAGSESQTHIGTEHLMHKGRQDALEIP